MTKTTDLKPCDNCGGPVAPIFYRAELKFRQVMIDMTAVNQVMGTAQILGGNMRLASVMSPNQDILIELPGYKIDKDLLALPELCAGYGR
ncbi:MAG: hypothetical protein HC804_04120 [Anaerolineae bacterium]|nr:hypothetical protein [Anaerolineae bacterium]